MRTQSFTSSPGAMARVKLQLVMSCCRAGSRAPWALLLAFGLGACSGVVDTPELDTLGGRGGAASTAGRGGAGNAGRGGASNAGRGGSAAAVEDAGSSGGGAGDDGDEPDAGSAVTPPDREYCDAVEFVFKATCGNGSCHTNRGVPIGDFGVGQAEAAAYVSRGSVRNAACGLIIDPVDPQKSLILTKVTGEYPQDQNCGGRMPIGSFEITDGQIACISDWLEQFRY